MKNKIISTLAGILLAGSVAGCVTEPNYTGAAYALRNISASGKALNGKSLTYEDQQKILNGADYLDYQQQRHNTRKDMKKEHDFQREMQRDEHKFQREMRNESSRREYAPDKEFYTALCKDSNRNGKIKVEDECLIKQNSFSNNDIFAVFSIDRASHKGDKLSMDAYSPNNQLIHHSEKIKYADTDGFGFTANVENFSSGIFKAYTRTNGVLDGALEFEIINDRFPEKEFYTSAWRDLNYDGNIKPDEIFEKKNFFSKNEYVSVNVVDNSVSVGSIDQVDVYCPNGNLAVSDTITFEHEYKNGYAIGLRMGIFRFDKCGPGSFGKYKVTRKTNGKFNGEIEFHLLSEDKSYL